jgi:hypothetical protein
MRVLEGCCGRGGWSKAFFLRGHITVGFDIDPKFSKYYKGEFFQADLAKLDGGKFQGFDFAVASTPCTEFSGPKHVWGPSAGHPPHPEEGLALINHWIRFVKEAQPKYWAMENIAASRKWFKEKPIWTFYISMNGRRHLWGNFDMGLTNEVRPTRVFGCTAEIRAKYGRKSVRNSSLRAEIPQSIATILADRIEFLQRK